MKKEIEDYAPDINFTMRSEDFFYDTVDLEDFKDREAEFIYECLQKRLRPIPFGDYLKRYIFQKSGMNGDYSKIELREYQEIIVESFRENHAPASFGETTSKLSALAKNWLTQESVKRQVVFLLGFGLNMGADDVSSFLVKAQKERDFNFKDPAEIIYWYCFKNGRKFSEMTKLKEAYESLPPGKSGDIYSDRTMAVRNSFKDVADDQSLMGCLAEFKTESQKCSYGVTSYKWFGELYQKCKQLIAEYYNSDESDALERKIQEYLDRVHGSEVLSDLDKKNQTDKMRRARKVWSADEITESDVEKILCCGTPTDDSGNLLKTSESKLSKHFASKRLSRQHLGELIGKKTAVDRFDLITLNFFVFSQDEKYKNNQKRFNDFIESANAILNECSMGELYIANPYECFLLMCVVSDAPFPTYSEVLEKSFEN